MSIPAISSIIPAVPGATEAVAHALQALLSDLQAQAGPSLAGLVLFGGLARGRYRAGRSDINVAVLLHSADPSVLQAIAPALGRARRAAAVEAMLITLAEVPFAALDFPTKFLDIQRHHVVLYGSDPFEPLQIPASLVHRCVAQSLRNRVLRLRHRYTSQINDPVALQLALAAMARPLAIDLTALLQVNAHTLPAEDRTAALYHAAAEAFALDVRPLETLAALRDGATDIDADALCQQLLPWLSDLANQVDKAAQGA